MKALWLPFCLALASSVTTIAQQDLRSVAQKSTDCKLPQGESVVYIDRMDEPMTRPVKTSTGSVPVTVQSGLRILIAHDDGSPFANVKAEKISEATWKKDSKTLADGVEFLAVSDPGILLAKLDGKKLNGFDVYGIDRQKREGGVLSVYLLLRDSDHLAITAYILNEDPPAHFKTIEEFGKLRDEFLETYSACLGH